MATVKRENIGELHDKLVVTITKEDYLPPFEKALKKYGKTMNVPGFRKGNVPAGLIRKMHGQSVFIDEVLRTANKELQVYLEEKQPDIFAQPLPLEREPIDLDMNKMDDLDFTFQIGLKPEFTVVALDKKGALKKYKIRVSDTMIEKETENLRKRAGKVEDIDALEGEDAIAYVDIAVCNPEGGIAEGAEKETAEVSLSAQPKPFATLLAGKKTGDHFTVKPSELLEGEALQTFMKEVIHAKPEAEKPEDAHYQINITKTGKLVPAEMNETFYEEIFPGMEIKEEAGFQAQLKEALEKETERIASEQMQNVLYETLVHETPLNLPVDFLKSWLKQEGGEAEKSDQAVEAEYPGFDHQLRWTLISDKLIKDLDVSVSREEVMDNLKNKVMGYFGMAAAGADEAPWLEGYMERMSKDEKTMNDTYRNLLFEKLFQKLETVMEVKTVEVGEEEFGKKVQEQLGQHHH